MAAKKTAKKTVKKATTSRTQIVAEIPKAALRTIARLDAIDSGIEERQALLLQLVNELGGSSFQHPTRGAMSIMLRDGAAFWRSKPEGRAVGTKIKKAAPAKKAAAKKAA